MSKLKNTIAERIREHLLDLLKSRKLSAGDKLPSYSQLCKRFSVSYASVQYAFKEFEKDGLVERVQGVGTFLKGSDELKVEMFLDTSAFPIEKLQPLVDLAVSAKGLHLNVKIRPLKEAFSIKKLSSKRRVVITQDIVESIFNPGSLLDLSSFSDYRFVVGQLKGFTTARPCNVALPFHSFTYQMAFNPLILQKVGFKAEKISGETMNWWSEYAAACRVAETPPGIKHWSRSGLASFGNLNHLIFPLLIREREKFNNLLSLPVFDTESGRTMLRIMKDMRISEAATPKMPAFHNGELGVELALGSWFAVHRATKFNIP
jgi:DNA-binding transcriptional regulator YhcF (GntR family)